MHERQQFEERSSAVALGLLAENMVVVTGRLLRQEPLRERDRPVLEDARRLLQMLADEQIVPFSLGAERMLADDAYRDALRVVRLRVPPDETREAAAALVALLDAALAGTLSNSEVEPLHALRAIFVDIGKSMLMRSNELARSRQENPAWRTMQPISLS